MLNAIDHRSFTVPLNPQLISNRASENSSVLTRKVNFFGNLLRDTLFYPLSKYQSNARQDEKDYRLLQNEEVYYKRFWTRQEPFDLNLENADLIREKYVVKDQPVVISDENGKKIISMCRVIESKECPPEGVFNAFLIPGNLSKLNNNLMPFYDLLVAHSKQENPFPLRVFIFGHYEMLMETGSGLSLPYHPPTLDATGEVLKRTIECLKEKFGKIDLIRGHSLGCIALSALLKRSGPELLPTMLYFDRGPTSLYEASKNYWFGGLLNLIGKCSGLAFHIDHEIKSFFKRCNKLDALNVQKSGCLITGAEEDFVFPGKSNLISSTILDKLQKRIKFAKWVFNPPAQQVHTRAHHDWRPMYFNKSYLTSSSGNVEMLPTENLAQAVLRVVSDT
jgi:hypothetical protein